MHKSLKKKIAVITGISRNDGGLFFAGASLYGELQTISPDLDVNVMGSCRGFSSEDRAIWGNVPVQTYRTYGPLKHAVGLFGSLTQLDPGLIHLNGIWLDNQRAVLKWQKLHNIPVVISPHGMLDPWALTNSAWKKKLVGAVFANSSLQQASCLHALCRSEVESIRAYGLTNPVALIPNGIHLPKFSRDAETCGSRKQLLFLGRIHPKKGLEELLRAWATVSTDWKLMIAGWDDGGHEQGLRSLVSELGLTDSVEFVGPKHGKEKDLLLQQADAFVLPSFSEGLPMSVLEAWSYELPVVMTDFCNLPEGFSAKAAIRIEPHSASIAEGLNSLMAMSASERATMACNGRMLVEEKFTWPKIAEAMYQVYEWCMDRGQPPVCMEFCE